MPLIKSASPSAVGPNITREESAGKSYPQSLAIALSTQDRARQPRAAGGGLSSSPSFEIRNAARSLGEDQYHPGGMIGGTGAGRTDRVPLAVAADSFVLPADVVSGMGQGSSLAGAKIMDGILSSGPYGVPLPRGRRADGGNTSDGGLSHVLVASGEYLVPRHKVEELGHRMRAGGKSKARTNLAAGHDALRSMVDRVRAHQKKFLAAAPKPKK